MDSIGVIKPDIAVVRQGFLSPFGLLSQLFTQELLNRNEQSIGQYRPMPLIFLEEENVGAQASLPEIHFDLNLELIVNRLMKAEQAREEETKKKEKTARERILERVIVREKEIRTMYQDTRRPVAESGGRRGTVILNASPNEPLSGSGMPGTRETGFVQRQAGEGRSTRNSEVLRRSAGLALSSHTPVMSLKGPAKIAGDRTLALASQALSVPAGGGWTPREREVHPGFPSQKAKTENAAIANGSILLPDVMRMRREAALARSREQEAGISSAPQSEYGLDTPGDSLVWTVEGPEQAPGSERMLREVRRAVLETIRRNKTRGSYDDARYEGERSGTAAFQAGKETAAEDKSRYITAETLRGGTYSKPQEPVPDGGYKPEAASPASVSDNAERPDGRRPNFDTGVLQTFDAGNYGTGAHREQGYSAQDMDGQGSVEIPGETHAVRDVVSALPGSGDSEKSFSVPTQMIFAGDPAQSAPVGSETNTEPHISVRGSSSKVRGEPEASVRGETADDSSKTASESPKYRIAEKQEDRVSSYAADSHSGTGGASHTAEPNGGRAEKTVYHEAPHIRSETHPADNFRGSSSTVREGAHPLPTDGGAGGFAHGNLPGGAENEAQTYSALPAAKVSDGSITPYAETVYYGSLEKDPSEEERSLISPESGESEHKISHPPETAAKTSGGGSEGLGSRTRSEDTLIASRGYGTAESRMGLSAFQESAISVETDMVVALPGEGPTAEAEEVPHSAPHRSAEPLPAPAAPFPEDAVSTPAEMVFLNATQETGPREEKTDAASQQKVSERAGSDIQFYRTVSEAAGEGSVSGVYAENTLAEKASYTALSEEPITVPEAAVIDSASGISGERIEPIPETRASGQAEHEPGDKAAAALPIDVSDSSGGPGIELKQSALTVGEGPLSEEGLPAFPPNGETAITVPVELIHRDEPEGRTEAWQPLASRTGSVPTGESSESVGGKSAGSDARHGSTREYMQTAGLPESSGKEELVTDDKNENVKYGASSPEYEQSYDAKVQLRGTAPSERNRLTDSAFAAAREYDQSIRTELIYREGSASEAFSDWSSQRIVGAQIPNVNADHSGRSGQEKLSREKGAKVSSMQVSDVVPDGKSGIASADIAAAQEKKPGTPLADGYVRGTFSGSEGETSEIAAETDEKDVTALPVTSESGTGASAELIFREEKYGTGITDFTDGMTAPSSALQEGGRPLEQRISESKTYEISEKSSDTYAAIPEKHVDGITPKTEPVSYSAGTKEALPNSISTEQSTASSSPAARYDGPERTAYPGKGTEEYTSDADIPQQPYEYSEAAPQAALPAAEEQGDSLARQSDLVYRTDKSETPRVSEESDAPSAAQFKNTPPKTGLSSEAERPDYSEKIRTAEEGRPYESDGTIPGKSTAAKEEGSIAPFRGELAEAARRGRAVPEKAAARDSTAPDATEGSAKTAIPPEERSDREIGAAPLVYRDEKEGAALREASSFPPVSKGQDNKDLGGAASLQNETETKAGSENAAEQIRNVLSGTDAFPESEVRSSAADITAPENDSVPDGSVQLAAVPSEPDDPLPTAAELAFREDGSDLHHRGSYIAPMSENESAQAGKTAYVDRHSEQTYPLNSGPGNGSEAEQSEKRSFTAPDAPGHTGTGHQDRDTRPPEAHMNALPAQYAESLSPLQELIYLDREVEIDTPSSVPQLPSGVRPREIAASTVTADHGKKSDFMPLSVRTQNNRPGRLARELPHTSRDIRVLAETVNQPLTHITGHTSGRAKLSAHADSPTVHSEKLSEKLKDDLPAPVPDLLTASVRGTDTSGGSGENELFFATPSPGLQEPANSPQIPHTETRTVKDQFGEMPRWAAELLENAGVSDTVSYIQVPGPGAGQAPGTRQITWTSPMTAVPQPKTDASVPAELSFKDTRGGEDTSLYSQRISDAEIQRTADKVYRLIEERLRRELRRSGR